MVIDSTLKEKKNSFAEDPWHNLYKHEWQQSPEIESTTVAKQWANDPYCVHWSQWWWQKAIILTLNST